MNKHREDRHIEKIVGKLGLDLFTEVIDWEEFQGRGLSPKNRLEAAQERGETSLVFLEHPTMQASDIQNTIQAIEKFFAKAIE